MNHPLGWHGFREDFPPHLLTLPSLSLFLYILTTVWMWIPFSFSIARCFEKLIIHIFVWRRPCNLIDYSKMTMCLIVPVILWLYTGCCSVRLALLTPTSAPGVGLVLRLAPWLEVIFPGYRWSVSFHSRLAFAETEESSTECVWMLLSLCHHVFYFTYGQQKLYCN